MEQHYKIFFDESENKIGVNTVEQHLQPITNIDGIENLSVVRAYGNPTEALITIEYTNDKIDKPTIEYELSTLPKVHNAKI